MKTSMLAHQCRTGAPNGERYKPPKPARHIQKLFSFTGDGAIFQKCYIATDKVKSPSMPGNLTCESVYRLVHRR